jgi:DNA helicase-4
MLASVGAIPGLIWAKVIIRLTTGKTFEVDGIPNVAAQDVVACVMAAKKDHDRQMSALLNDFQNAVTPVLTWVEKAKDGCKKQLNSRGWLTQEFKHEFNRNKPLELQAVIDEPEIAEHVTKASQTTRDAIATWRRPFESLADNINQAHMLRERESSRSFFETIEKSPLTEEQIAAVVCFDNRILVIASAGSGKTSTMVAKAAYALKKGYFSAERILLLAFNNDAAAELRERLKARLSPLGLPGDKVAAKTFHAFGLEIIGAATGKRPSLAPWLEHGRDLQTLLELVDELKDKDLLFRSKWDLFRVVLGQDLPKFGDELKEPEAWDKETRREGFWTLNNEVVKSRGEQVIANWLFYNGVEYVYEGPYKISTADSSHRQYRPDFYFPSIDAYLEHWALDERGEAPAEFTGYKEGMAWKRSVHANNGTTLLETTMAGLWSGQALNYLATELTKRGIVLDPNPDRPALGRKPIENPRLARTFRSFLTHAKSNRMSLKELRQRLDMGAAGHFRFRHTMFLDLFEAIWNAWESRLRAEECIDFEDMLNLASDCVDSGKWTSPYDLVMVDEFQDSSHARARLVEGLVKPKGKCLFAVGDDWQSINRFAGADLAVMTEFEHRFGTAVTLRLERTFRCPQSLCDISSLFVQQNPRQLKKKVLSSKPNVLEPVVIMQVDETGKIRTAIAKRIEEIASAAAADGRKVRIYILGRYQNDKQYVPVRYDETRVEVEFMTVHSSKGLEADHVILPKMVSGTLGFPCGVADDPVLQLAMPEGESFKDAEERRLFYVALTRTRATVTLVTVVHQESSFILELVRTHRFVMRKLDGSVSSSEMCPGCGEGFLVKRKSKHGLFYGCSRYPRCKHTKKIEALSRQSH